VLGGLMMEDFALIKYFIGIFITAAGFCIAAFRNLSQRISSGDRLLQEKIEKVKEDYVRRVDLQNMHEDINRHLALLRNEFADLKRYNETHNDLLKNILNKIEK
jgi:hypothetical protein